MGTRQLRSDRLKSCEPTNRGAGRPYCDDINATVAELKAQGVEFSRDIRDDGFGLTTLMKVPGGFEVQLYQPNHDK